MKQIYIFDTTLRDGQQSPGAAMSLEDNIQYAHIAKKLQIDVLEAWFPSASAYEFERVQRISDAIVDGDSPVIVWLTQARQHLVDKTIESLLPAAKYDKGRMHIYFPVDPHLIKAGLWDKDIHQFPKKIHNFCKQAYDAWLSVEFSPEGYSRIDGTFSFTTDLICAAIEWGATIINCPDTIGWAHPRQGNNYYVHTMQKHATAIAEKYPDKNIIRSVHNHNDLGYALTNSLNGIIDGPATQIECTMNGVGERAGNCSLEQVAMHIHIYGKEQWVYTHLSLEYLQEASDFIAQRMLPRQTHRPITWDNAARHTSWWHVNALLENPTVYQPFDPCIVWKSWISLVFGPSSWGNHAQHIVQEAWRNCPDQHKATFAQYIKTRYQERYKWLSDKEVVAWFVAYMSPVSIDAFSYAKHDGHSSLSLQGTFFDTQNPTKEADSKDSALAILQALFDEHMPWRRLTNYSSKADTWSINALSIATIDIQHSDWRHMQWVARDADIEISALKALIAAYNTAYVEEKYKVFRTW